MIACSAIGDSIAVGVGQARPDCETTARVGITSERYITSLLPLAETGADTTIISLGVNDDSSVDTLGNLRRVRREVKSRTVFWLLPGIKESVRDDIATVARENGDRLIDTRPQVGRDHLHPTGTGYLQIAAQTYGDGGGARPYQAPPPVEVAEAAAPPRRSFDPAFRINYAELPVQHAGRLAGREVYYFNIPRRLSAFSTPHERIRNLRAERQMESAPFRVSYAHTQHEHVSGYAPWPAPARASARTAEPMRPSHANGPSSHAAMPASHASLPMPPHPVIVRSARTVQACTSAARACGGRSVHG